VKRGSEKKNGVAGEVHNYINKGQSCKLSHEKLQDSKKCYNHAQEFSWFYDCLVRENVDYGDNTNEMVVEEAIAEEEEKENAQLHLDWESIHTKSREFLTDDQKILLDYKRKSDLGKTSKEFKTKTDTLPWTEWNLKQTGNYKANLETIWTYRENLLAEINRRANNLAIFGELENPNQNLQNTGTQFKIFVNFY
jgi:hypothetical protein